MDNVGRQRAIFKCVVSDCPFHIHASWSKRKECVVVGAVVDRHTCVGVGPIVRRHTASKQKWLQRVLPAAMVISKSTTASAVVGAIGLELRVCILHSFFAPHLQFKSYKEFSRWISATKQQDEPRWHC